MLRASKYCQQFIGRDLRGPWVTVQFTMVMGRSFAVPGVNRRPPYNPPRFCRGKQLTHRARLTKLSDVIRRSRGARAPSKRVGRGRRHPCAFVREAQVLRF
jgi:hypothetical protein